MNKTKILSIGPKKIKDKEKSNLVVRNNISMVGGPTTRRLYYEKVKQELKSIYNKDNN